MRGATIGDEAGEGTLSFTTQELSRARMFNAVLGILPRYHVDRRWNAKCVQAMTKAVQSLVPDRAIRHGEAVSRFAAANGRKIGLRLIVPKGAPHAGNPAAVPH